MPESASCVELADGVIVARLRGNASEELLRRTQDEVFRLAASTGGSRVLLDVTEMNPPPLELVSVQRRLDEDRRASRLRRAIVVPDSRVAFLIRLAFGEGDYRVFYNDRAGAVKWLEGEAAGSRSA